MLTQIFLTGGGESDHFTRLDRHFVQSLGEGAKILVLPQANEVEDYQDTWERMQETFCAHGRVEVDMVENLDDLSAEYLEDYQAIYVDGGNTFNLIQSVRSSALPQLIKPFCLAGGVIYGDSAGAIVLGASVQTAFLGDEGDDNEASLQSFHGLDLLAPWSLHCHYTPDDHESVQDFVYDFGGPVFALAEETGIYLQDNQVQVFGSTPLQIYGFEGRKSVSPGEIVDLVG